MEHGITPRAKGRESRAEFSCRGSLHLPDSKRALGLGLDRKLGPVNRSDWLRRDCLQPEGVVSGRKHCKGYRDTIRPGVIILGLEPRAEAGIVNLGLVLPKIRPQPTLNLEMIQMQLDDLKVPGKITPDIGSADVQPCHTTAFALCLDHHICLPFNVP